ncbi:uncharacterized protein LOC128674062 isoform X2 [Plodia interpunctella]|uniref:uncharacterized protein LOC128674062 isoform X2 n=1 Tax=Plodia interpunctella TaxID=58824 RepID=UPI00236785F6|nr:uncharacterized protein LOC128674062 isoform X2 [Plodia interpunctella]
MTRRKIVFLKWTLVLLVVIFCPSVCPRPQDSSPSLVISSSTSNIDKDKPTENPIRESSQKNEGEPQKTEQKSPVVDVTQNSGRDVKTKAPVIRESIKLVANQLLNKPSNTSGGSSVVADVRVPPKIKNQVSNKHTVKTRNEDGDEPIENGHAGIAVPVTMEELEKENKISESSTTNEGGSAINENVYNKIKDTVLSNVQKNKVSTTQRTTTVSSTVPPTTTEVLTTKKEVTKVASTVSPVVKITSKPTKKKNKNKHKVTSTTLAPEENESALLPMEPKEQEIELEISTPATTTKKPKRSSTKKKNKTKKRKTTKKPETETAVSDIKTTNKTKSTKPAKKPTSITGPFTTQIYNYLSREVMPVGVGVIGLASLVGLASYFLYPFSTPVRRNIDIGKKDNLFENNAEEYAIEGNGQAEEEMLGTVLAGMPAHAKHTINPYAGQTVAHGNTRYTTVKKEQDIRYRHVAANREPNYNYHYPQQKTGIAHGAIYSKPINYNPHQYETRNIYTTESKYAYDKGSSAYTPYPAVEPIYAAPQTGPTSGTGYGSDTSSSVVYGVKPTSDTEFRPVYPFEGQIYSETTVSSATYPPTSMYLGSNNDAEDTENDKYEENESSNGDETDNKFVVGNVPKELSESATPAVVPEHGPRKLRKKRQAVNMGNVNFRESSIEELLNDTKNRKDIFMSNEIDDSFGYVKHIASLTNQNSVKDDVTSQPESKDVFTVYAEPANPSVDQKTTSTDVPSTYRNDIIESVSTLPIDTPVKSTTDSATANELEVTTKSFRVYEVFSTQADEQNSPLIKGNTDTPIQETTSIKNVMTETTTELKSETTSTISPSLPSVSTVNYKDDTDVITYPPPRQENGFLSLLRRFLEFKYRLGMSILQTTSDNLKRYLEDTVHNVTKAS